MADRADDAVAWQRLAGLYPRTAAFDKAKAAYEQVLRINPQSTSAMVGLAELGTDDPRASQLAAKARAADPRDVELAKAFAILSLRQGDARYAAQLQSARQRSDRELIYYHRDRTGQ